MITITYNVGNALYKKDINFNHTISEEVFEGAIVRVAEVFKQAQQGMGVNTTEVVEAPAPKETTRVVSVTSKKEKVVNEPTTDIE